MGAFRDGDETLEVAKAVWTHADFETMGWHDCTVHALAMVDDEPPAPAELTLDLDYILSWVKRPDGYYGFWISPATLVFHDVWGVTGELEAQRALLEIDDLRPREDVSPSGSTYTTWILLGHDFELEVIASGFTQWLRRPPVLTDGQRLSSGQRGGHSFDRVQGW